MPIALTDDERTELARRAGLPERGRADRARIVLACADGIAQAVAEGGDGAAGKVREASDAIARLVRS